MVPPPLENPGKGPFLQHALRACSTKQTALGISPLVTYIVNTETVRSPPGENHQSTSEEM